MRFGAKENKRNTKKNGTDCGPIATDENDGIILRKVRGKPEGSLRKWGIQKESKLTDLCWSYSRRLGFSCASVSETKELETQPYRKNRGCLPSRKCKAGSSREKKSLGDRKAFTHTGRQMKVQKKGVFWNERYGRVRGRNTHLLLFCLSPRSPTGLVGKTKQA